MASFKALCLAGVASLAVTAAAHAADLLPPPPPVEAPAFAPPAPVAFGGWYLRGDVGVGLADLKQTSSEFNKRSDVQGFQKEGSLLDDAAFIDGGVGYRINQYFRVDATAEYRATAHYNNNESASCHFVGCGYPRYLDSYNGSVNSVTGLVNAYVDAGTWYGFTPWAGAGVGVTRVGFRNVVDTGFGASVGGMSTPTNTYTTNFAWALMAGLDFQVTQNLTMELGYRYLNQGNVSVGPIKCYPSSGPCPNEVQRFKLSSNDIRLGFRYTFADLVPAAPAFPLIRKY